MFQSVVKPALFLCVATVIIAAMLGVVHHVTEAPIQAQLDRQLLSAKQALLPEATTFDSVTYAEDPKSTVTNVEQGLDAEGSVVGYVVTVAPKGYGGIILTMVGFDPQLAITSYRILEASETPGLGDLAGKPAFTSQFVGKSLFPIQVVKMSPSDTEVEAITGATVTSKAIVQGVNHAAQALQAIEE